MIRSKIIALCLCIILSYISHAQVRLTSVETSATKWDIPVAKRVIPGQTGKYFQTYMTLSNLMDSLGISGGGGTGLLGVDPRIPYFSSTTTLYHTTNLKWDTIIQALRVRNIPIGSNASEQLYAGQNAGTGATGATYSNFFGYDAGTGATNASYSNFFGLNSGMSATGASYSNFFGYEAGSGATNSTYSNYFGREAGKNASSGQNNNYFGYQAGLNATSAIASNFFGANAGTSATNASYSNFFGTAAGTGATNATFSNFFGLDAGNGATGAQFSNFFGLNAGKTSTGGQFSNFFGNDAGNGATSASYSNFLGKETGKNATAASFSNIFGFNSGTAFTGNNIGSNNIIIGTNISLPNTAADAINIGGVLFGTGTQNVTSGDPKIIATAGGKVGVMTVAPTQELHVTGNARVTGAIYDSNNEPGTSGQVLSSTATGTDWIAASSGGITTLGSQTGSTQTFATGTTGTDFNISSATDVHTFNIPSASAANRGLVTTGTQTFAGAKTFSYLGGAPVGGNSLIVADINGRLENLYGISGTNNGHVPRWNGTSFTLQAGGISSLGGQTGTTHTFDVGNAGTYPSWSSASNVHTYRLPTASSGQVLKFDGTGWKADTDNNTFQTLSFSSPNLSISGGNSVALPVLPAGASSNTMAYISAAWSTSAFLKNNSTTTVTGNNKRVEINNDTGGEQWPSSINTLTKFLVNGRIQLNSTSSTACTTLMGQNTDMEVGDVTVGNGLTISGGTLSSADGNFGQLSKSSTSQQLATTSMAKVTFDAAVSGGTTATPSTANEEITIGATGLYEVSFNCANIAGTANRTISFMIYIGTTAITNTLGATTKAANDYTTYHFQEILSLTSGDLINVRMAYDNATGSGTDIYVVSPRLIVKRKT